MVKSIVLLFLYYYYYYFASHTPLSTPLPLPILHSAVWYPGPSAQLVTADDKQLTLWKVKGDAAKVAVCTPQGAVNYHVSCPDVCHSLIPV